MAGGGGGARKGMEGERCGEGAWGGRNGVGVGRMMRRTIFRRDDDDIARDGRPRGRRYLAGKKTPARTKTSLSPTGRTIAPGGRFRRGYVAATANNVGANAPAADDDEDDDDVTNRLRPVLPHRLSRARDRIAQTE